MHSTTKSFSHTSLTDRAENGTFEMKAVSKKEKKTVRYQRMASAGAGFMTGVGVRGQGGAAVKGKAEKMLVSKPGLVSEMVLGSEQVWCWGQRGVLGSEQVWCWGQRWVLGSEQV